ncbi:TetR/AcrR family transcriptional regulator C-terminal domain-containing protein [Nonomuraea rhizosphaerae]|uniref:TetR/AcrR family transcriptional regulator C-terminal domain-containing protein n=1 Tax=Nonomuraea rhizosphaerae TaxID=2665663 RepID=UPI0027E2E131|nr:TetR/AcrR family transcriptional regulator C-terminal domain-containing protein [Nonomuraea rhizosphaerae]
MDGAPPYARIVDDIKRRIADGELRPGDRVPSTRQLARDWDVALATATKALARLSQEGVVVAEPRVGTLVAPARTPSATTAASSRGGPSSEDGVSARGSAFSGDVRGGRPDEPGARDLTRERVVRTAVEIADAEGLAALSMRAVAGRLGVATMSLYRHVAGKDDLVELMVDAVLTDFPLPAEPPDGWRARLEVMARLQWAAYRRHPWMARITSLTRPLPSPSLLRHTEWALAAVEGHGLDPESMMHVHILLYSYVQGIAANIELEIQAEAATGLTGDEWMRTQDTHLTAIAHSGAYPTFVAVVERLGGDFDLNLDRLFEFGLRPLLDGLTTVIEGAPHPSRPEQGRPEQGQPEQGQPERSQSERG